MSNFNIILRFLKLVKMAGTDRKDFQDLNLTREEVENLKEALKKEEFRKLLAEYAEEITSPESRKQYQEEIIQLEAERGVDCTFVNPEPGFVIKTSVDGKKKAFINICKNKAIGSPWSKPSVNENGKGLTWSIPFSQSPAREDHDKKNNRCLVYDVVFHPNTLHLAENNFQFKKLVVDTALNAIEDSYKVKLDKKNLKYPKLKFKGIPVAAVIRKKSKKQPILTEDEIEFQKNINYPAPPPLEDNKPVVRNFDHVKEDKEKYTFPKYVIKHRTGIHLENFTYDRNCNMHATLPKELVVEVNLPLLSSTKEVTLDVMEKSIHLISEKPAKYKLDIQLPYCVNEEEGNAKFDKDQRLLVITLPVIKAKKSISDLMREDSGVESDFGDRCPSCDDSSPIGSVDDEDKTNEQSNVGSTTVLECDTSDKNAAKTCNGEKAISSPFRTSFLDCDKLYLLPSFKCNVDGKFICFVLNVKNVNPTSLTKQLEGINGCHLKFLTLGAGFCPVFYAFLIKFQAGSIIKDVEIHVWDNNVTVQFEMENPESVLKYYVGVDEDSLILKDLSEFVHLEKKHEKIKLDTKAELEDENDKNDKNDEDVSVTIESADLNEVAIKILPKDKKGGKKNKNKGGESGKVALDKKQRTFSESSTEEATLSPVTRKSILKNRICRSLSESNAEDYALGSSIEASEGSDLCIPEETDEPHSAKKTVRFNNRVRKQIFRANSSILGQKKKNQKRSRNKRKVAERRTSESENSECEEKEREKRTNPLIEEFEEKNNGNNCDISKTVISEENESAPNEAKDEIRFMAKKDDKIFEFKSDLIFDLDL